MLGINVAGSQDDGYLESSSHQGNYAGNVDNRSSWSLAWAPKRWINWLIVWVTPLHYSLTPAVTTDQWLIPLIGTQEIKAESKYWQLICCNFNPLLVLKMLTLTPCMFVGAHAPGLCWPVFSNPLDDELQVLSSSPPPGGSLTVTDSGVERSPALAIIW